ncbi:MAG: CBS domain-containing protein [Opitutus sp.]|nr:CBS domain-containing protein [Opitutus sp.]
MVARQEREYLGPMNVRELMSTGVVCVCSASTLLEAGTLMRQLGATALPVCENDRLAGILTERDLAVLAVQDTREPRHLPVREAMARELYFVFEDDDVLYAARTMEEHTLDHLPVLTRDHRIAGMLALTAVAEHLHELHAASAHSPAASEPPRLSDR